MTVQNGKTVLKYIFLSFLNLLKILQLYRVRQKSVHSYVGRWLRRRRNGGRGRAANDQEA
jgi:hypothetical protein